MKKIAQHLQLQEALAIDIITLQEFLSKLDELKLNSWQ